MATRRSHDDPDPVPTVGQIMEQITRGAFDADEDDRAYPQRLADTIY